MLSYDNIYVDRRVFSRLEVTIIANITDAANFLKRFKHQATLSGIDFIPRRANLDALANLGTTIADAETTLLELSAKNYISGPTQDHDGSTGEIWVFGTVINHDNIYIKLKLETGRAACISFHEALRPLVFPFH
jgi:Motility quorum-sensing regulator, toxin of MqsA